MDPVFWVVESNDLISLALFWALDKIARSWHWFLIHYQGIAMAISTTAFGIYFYLMARIHNPTSLNLMMQQTSEEPHVDLTWLALASMAVFISGESPNYNSYIKICAYQPDKTL